MGAQERVEDLCFLAEVIAIISDLCKVDLLCRGAVGCSCSMLHGPLAPLADVDDGDLGAPSVVDSCAPAASAWCSLMLRTRNIKQPEEYEDDTFPTTGIPVRQG